MSRLGGMVLAGALALVGCSKSDEHVSETVKARLASEPTPLSQLQVSTKDRIVKLEGVVSTEAERDRLERIVRDMDGVLAVDNRLTVQRPVQTTAGDIAFAPDDRAIRDGIRKKLDEAGIQGVTLDVRDRIVRLEGEVDRARHADAVRIARDAGLGELGAQRVDDQLVLR